MSATPSRSRLRQAHALQTWAERLEQSKALCEADAHAALEQALTDGKRCTNAHRLWALADASAADDAMAHQRARLLCWPLALPPLP